MEEGGLIFENTFLLRQKYIMRRSIYSFEGTEENGWVMSERERKMKKDVWSSLYWPFRVFCCCICQQTISKPFIPSSSLSLRDISILASFDGSENAVGIRWKFHPSIFFSGSGPKERELYEVSENIPPPQCGKWWEWGSRLRMKKRAKLYQ